MLSQNQQQKNVSQTANYSTIVEQGSFPTKEQAIILDAIEKISVHEYTVAIGKIVKPENILYVSRISNSRICLYLSSKELVANLCDNNTQVNIGNTNLSIRPLISKSKRIIISNVCPIIPHSVIETELKRLDINPVS